MAENHDHEWVLMIEGDVTYAQAAQAKDKGHRYWCTGCEETR